MISDETGVTTNDTVSRVGSTYTTPSVMTSLDSVTRKSVLNDCVRRSAVQQRNDSRLKVNQSHAMSKVKISNYLGIS